MTSHRSPFRTAGAILVGAALTLAAAATLVLAGVVQLPKITDSRSSAPAQAPTTDVAAPAPKSGSLSSLYKQVSAGVAFVEVQTGQGTASGSGFLLDTGGHIVTNEHVVEGAQAVQVRLGDKGSPVDAQVVGADPGTDIAVLKVDPSALGDAHALALGDSSKLQIGQSAVAIGSPFGLSGTLTTGIVSALDRSIQSPSNQTIDGAIQTDAAINPGNSGGPLLNRSGQVIGINAQIASQSGTSSGVGFAIPIDTVKQVVPQIENGSLGQQSQQQDQQGQGQIFIDPQTGEQVDPSTGQPVDPSQGGEQVDPSQGDPGLGIG